MDISQPDGEQNTKGHYIDAAWKRVLSDGIDDAIAFFLPDLAKDRDASREIAKAMDAFPVLDSEGDKGMRITDLCFSVPVMGGESRKVGLFVEQQHEDDEEFALRVFQTFYRMSDSFKEKITALAIFTGGAKDRNEYLYSCYGVELSFRYNTYHILSHDIEELRRDGRAFAPVVLGARMMIAAKGKAPNREKYVRELLNILRERDYDMKRRRFIMKFIGNILNVRSGDISAELRREFYMQWVPMSEVQRKLAIEDIKEEGKMEVARKMLAKGIPVETIEECTGLDEGDILALS
ncbi:MAG: hypothetical protein LBQ36_09840 [Synergistaceae bacterium]|jgi:hypothetical protein|nr:hypothetical protein [Synergistaceae bacterium]